jgi:hypothetical protein
MAGHAMAKNLRVAVAVVGVLFGCGNEKHEPNGGRGEAPLPGPTDPHKRSFRIGGGAPGASGAQLTTWSRIRSEVLQARDDIEFFRGLSDIHSSDDEELRQWGDVMLGLWSPVFSQGVRATSDPLDSPEGDPAWEKLKALATDMGLEKEVAENPRGGPRLAVAMRKLANISCWVCGTSSSGTSVEVQLDAFEPGLVFKMELGRLEGGRYVRIGTDEFPVDSLSFVGTLHDGRRQSLATLRESSMIMPGSLMANCTVTGVGRESIHVWLRNVDDRQVRWWVSPVRLPAKGR